jgi:hypothetical protein
MASIESLLHRRPDLSTFLVHLTRQVDERSPRQNLCAILHERCIRARNPYGMAKDHEALLAPLTLSQKVVCFSETPLEHAWMMVHDIEKRRAPLSSYGLVFTRIAGRRRACDPVWYLDITPGHDWLVNPVQRLVTRAVRMAGLGATRDTAPVDLDVLRLAPFIEQMGPMNNGGRKEFWWEREWRHTGDFGFEPDEVVAILAPEHDHRQTRADVADTPFAPRPILDPHWGLQRMIAALAGVPARDSGPFPR